MSQFPVLLQTNWRFSFLTSVISGPNVPPLWSGSGDVPNWTQTEPNWAQIGLLVLDRSGPLSEPDGSGPEPRILSGFPKQDARTPTSRASSPPFGSAPRSSRERAPQIQGQSGARARASGHLKVLRHREPEQNRENRSRAGFGADGSALKQQDEAEPSPRVRFWTRTDTIPNPVIFAVTEPTGTRTSEPEPSRSVTRPIQTRRRTEPTVDQQESDGTRTGTRTCSWISECLAFCSGVLVLLGSSDVVPVLIRSRGPAGAPRAHGPVGLHPLFGSGSRVPVSDGFISDICFKIFEIKIFYFRFLWIKWTEMIIFSVRSFKDLLKICIKILKSRKMWKQKVMQKCWKCLS